MNKKHAISPTRKEDFSQWYLEIVKAAQLAESSDVRGCMVIKPWGYGIWENIQKILDRRFKELGHENAYFPLFIPLKYMEKEAKHVEGFAKECAVVTHTRLKQTEEGTLQPSDPLEEPLIVRPTSETIIGDMFAKWIQSYRDLPVKINQWCNIVRWEMRTRMFLRTTEILWQEGHTAHATKQEAFFHAREMLGVYEEFVKNYLAIPAIVGKKPDSERFPGADDTYTFELMMQDRKALQGGTSHYLGQNFSKAANIRFRAENGEEIFAFTTSWGVTTRLIGALLMVHSDDDGAVIPPRIAPFQVVILPVIHKEEMTQKVLSFCQSLQQKISRITYLDGTINCKLDDRDLRGGEKMWQWIKKGIPIRLEVGPRDIEKNSVCLFRRDFEAKNQESILVDDLERRLPQILDEIHNQLYTKALAFLQTHTKYIQSKEKLYDFFQKEGGFAVVYCIDNPSVEEKLKQDLQITPRCIPFEKVPEGICIFTGKKTNRQVIFAKAY